MSQQWYRGSGQPIMQMQVPRLYGSTPTLFGAPIAETRADLEGADVAFLGVPWRAPTPESRMGRAAANFEGTLLTPSLFRANSLKYGGYLPELDLDVFAHFKLVDRGDVEVRQVLALTFANVEAEVGAIIDAGCIPVTIGGNSGPVSNPTLKAIVDRAGGPVAILNFDAHSDNRPAEAADDDPRQPQWGSAWAYRVLKTPGFDPARYFHFGLRGPRSDPQGISRITDAGARRENIVTYRDLKQARRGDFDEFAAAYARRVVEGAAKVWIAVDPDVLDIGSNPSFGDEPLGPKTEEVLETIYQVGRAAGRERFGGLTFMAIPYDAQTLQYICIYILLYALAGVASADA